MTNPDIIPLIEKYLAGQATAEERQAVFDWYRAADLTEIRIPIEHAGEMEDTRQRLLAVLRQHTAQPKVAAVPLYRRAAAVAAVLLLLAGGGWWYVHRPATTPPAPIAAAPMNDVLPGHNGAILTLADGTSKVLDSLHAGVIAVQGKTTVTLGDGKLSYAPAGPASATMTYNTMSTPRGRQYQLFLPDGTRVWLNAASSLTYPTAFSGPDRTVSLTGEAYFEVHHDPKPFKVRTAGQTIEDLGTHFNINAYTDEPATTTTLLEGMVRVNGRTLQPGQQARSAGADPVRVTAANTEQAVAWKNGVFSFTDATLPVVLRQLARWYAVDVEYRGPITTRVFSGEIGRSLTLSQVLRILTRSHIHYQIENGNKLIILPGDS